MILPDLVLPSYANRLVSTEGCDSIFSRIKDKRRWLNWPAFEYRYNSRGFRDQEWPKNLESSIWCLGDSFTVGLGSSVQDTWPYILGQRLLSRTINVSMNGASNDWISRRTLDIIKTVAPKTIVVHWSYIHRRELDQASLSDEQRRIWHKDETERLNNSQEINLANFIENVSKVEQGKNQTQIIHSFVPAYSKEPKINGHRIVTERMLYELNLSDVVPEFDILDYSRDEIHYHVKTAKYFVDQIIKKIIVNKNTISNIRTL